jgi:precorrin-3B C17-methyltransferase
VSQQPGGWLAIVGLGPGDPQWLLPAARDVLRAATDLVGYATYLDLVPRQPQLPQRRHASDNRQELDRARLALDLACRGQRVAVVSSGDPGVFAMAAAVFETQFATDAPAAWRALDVQVIPGVTAALGAAARVGAPLGHDWCSISLSDNLKPWAIIERRLVAALDADFALALYNPVSSSRPDQLTAAFALIRARRAATTPIVVARAVGRAAERVSCVPLARVDLAACDMQTMILVGSSTTRLVTDALGRARVFTPRWYPAEPPGSG